MKYSIFYLIRGEAEKYHQSLVRKVGPMFGENYLVENPLPSHVSLKGSFESDKIKEIEKLLEDFVESLKPVEIKIEGFDNFRKFVAFLKIEFSKNAINAQRELVEKLQEVGIDPKEHDLDFKPHATVSYGNTPETFDKIWGYLQGMDKPEFNLKFDNITIMKQNKNGLWEIYRMFEIK